MTLSGATTLGQSGPGSDGNEGLLSIPQGSCITGVWPSNFWCHTRTLVEGDLRLYRDGVGVFFSQSLLGQTLWITEGLEAMAMKGYFPFTIKVFNVIYWTLIGGVLRLYRVAVGVFYSTSRLGKYIMQLG